jgi:hypothetical protein
MDALSHVTRLKALYDNVHVHVPKLVSTILQYAYFAVFKSICE